MTLILINILAAIGAWTLVWHSTLLMQVLSKRIRLGYWPDSTTEAAIKASESLLRQQGLLAHHAHEREVTKLKQDIEEAQSKQRFAEGELQAALKSITIHLQKAP
jgi:hypothetical protein